MIELTCAEYAEYIDVDLETKLQPINQCVDDILTRLEEFETMVLLIQQERCNAIGLTGSLSDCMDIQPQLTALCQRVDTMENLMEYLKTHIEGLENKVQAQEEKFGLNDNANVFTNFLKSSLFKKVPEVKNKQPAMNADTSLETLSIKEYFMSETDDKTNTDLEESE